MVSENHDALQCDFLYEADLAAIRSEPLIQPGARNLAIPAKWSKLVQFILTRASLIAYHICCDFWGVDINTGQKVYHRDTRLRPGFSCGSSVRALIA